MQGGWQSASPDARLKRLVQCGDVWGGAGQAVTARDARARALPETGRRPIDVEEFAAAIDTENGKAAGGETRDEGEQGDGACSEFYVKHKIIIAIR